MSDNKNDYLVRQLRERATTLDKLYSHIDAEYMRDAADEIALAQAERDFWRTADAKSVERAEAAEAKIKELELHLYDYEREIH